MRALVSVFASLTMALIFSAASASAQSAIPKPAEGGEAAAAAPAAPAAKKTAKKKTPVKCDGLFEGACKEASGCSWSGGLVKADGSPPKGECVKVSKTADKGTKDSCPTMFEALCKETAGCAWGDGAPGADGKPGAGSCSFAGKAKKTATAKKEAPPAAAAQATPEPAPDAFTDQQEK